MLTMVKSLVLFVMLHTGASKKENGKTRWKKTQQGEACILQLLPIHSVIMASFHSDIKSYNTWKHTLNTKNYLENVEKMLTLF